MKWSHGILNWVSFAEALIKLQGFLFAFGEALRSSVLNLISCKFLVQTLCCSQAPWTMSPSWLSSSLCPQTIPSTSRILLIPIAVQSLSCVWLCEPMDCSTPGFPVLHHLPEFAQTHVHWVSDAIQPSHPVDPLSCFQSFLASGSFPKRQLFASGGQSIGASILALPSFQWIFRVDFV